MCSVFGITGWVGLALVYAGSTVLNVSISKLFKAGIAFAKAHNPFNKTPPVTPPAG